MDEVKAMGRAGETVGRAVGSGWLAVRRGAVRAGHAGAEATVRAAQAADRKLAEHGVAPQQLSVAIAEGAGVARQEVAKTTRRTRKKLARTAKRTRKDLAKAAKQARKDARKSRTGKRAVKTAKQAKADARKMQAALKAEAVRFKQRARDEAVALKLMEAPKKRRRWPKVLLVTAAAAGAAYVVRSKLSPPEPTNTVPEPQPRAGESAPTGTTQESTTGNGQHNGRATTESTTKHS